MNGWLIYDREGAARNAWFIARLKEKAEELGARLELVYAEDLMHAVKGYTERGTDCSDGACRAGVIDFAVVRTICPDINMYFESRKVPCFNNYKTAFAANDKWQTYIMAEKLGLPAMETCLLSDIQAGARSLSGFAYPLVVKSRTGHGGSEVYRIDGDKELAEFIKNCDSSRYICQPMCSEPGIDVRVYVLDGKVIAAAERRSQSDFRSNFSLGGSARIVDVTKEQKNIASAVCKELDCDFVGVDFILHGGRWILNEVEDSVGTRMLYKLTKIDAAELYMRHIIGSIA